MPFLQEKGHILKACHARNKTQQIYSRTNQLESESKEKGTAQEYSISHTRASNSQPIKYCQTT